MKNQIIKDHFINPRRMGSIENPTHQTIIKSETCSDVVKMMLIIDNNGIVSDIRSQVYGCGYAIAGTSIFNEIAVGKKATEIYDAALELINSLLPDTPESNINCMKLALKAFTKFFKTPDRN